MASDDREVELKYAMVDSDAVRELVAADTIAGLRTGPWRTSRITDRYVDTVRRTLEKAGFGARLREVDDQTTLTLKTDVERPDGGAASGASSALHDRIELEGPATRKLQPANWPASEARATLERLVGHERLRQLFSISQHRVERDLIDGSGAIVATLSVDEATVDRNARRLGAFTTLEVEASDGTDGGHAALARIATELEASGLVRPEGRSKLDIGLELVAESHPSWPRPPSTPGVAAEDSMAEAARKVLRMHLLRMLAAENAVRDVQDVDAVKKMRVATRRMRAAWRVFDGAYVAKVQNKYVRELRTVARSLGAVRDLDVQIDRLDHYADAYAGAVGTDLAPLRAEWLRRREGAETELLELLDSARYERFVADYATLVEDRGGDQAEHADGTVRVRDGAASRIWRAYEHVRAHDAGLQFADTPALHELRIDGKRLRYTLEFFREVLPPATDALVAELTAQQDHLGLLNDAQVAASMTREWLLDAAASLASGERRATAAYLAASERDMAALRRSFPRIWRRIAGVPFRRRLAFAVSEI